MIPLGEEIEEAHWRKLPIQSVSFGTADRTRSTRRSGTFCFSARLRTLGV